MDETRIAEAVGKAVRSLLPRSITPQEAHKLAKAVRCRARSMGVKAVIAVLDAHANPILCEAEEGAYIASWDIALNKSYTVVALKMSTAALAELAAPGGELYGIQFTNGGKIVVFGGGEPLESEGRIIGGLGVSGGSAQQDTALAAYGKQIFKEICSDAE